MTVMTKQLLVAPHKMLLCNNHQEVALDESCFVLQCNQHGDLEIN